MATDIRPRGGLPRLSVGGPRGAFFPRPGGLCSLTPTHVYRFVVHHTPCRPTPPWSQPDALSARIVPCHAATLGSPVPASRSLSCARARAHARAACCCTLYLHCTCPPRRDRPRGAHIRGGVAGVASSRITHEGAAALPGMHRASPRPTPRAFVIIVTASHVLELPPFIITRMPWRVDAASAGCGLRAHVCVRCACTWRVSAHAADVNPTSPLNTAITRGAL